MTDMDVFLLLSLYPKLLNFSQEAALELIREETGLPVSKLDAQNILSHPPSTKQLVHALHDRGSRPNYIQEYLGISQPTVSYHLATNAKPYVNVTWRDFERYWADVRRKQSPQPD